MKNYVQWLLVTLLLPAASISAQQLYAPPPAGVETRWVSPENPTGDKGMGGITNKGAKGNAFFIVAPGEKKVLFNVRGAGIINRIWMAGSVVVNHEQKRSVRLDMYWDDAQKPAVSAPIGDFFGVGLGLTATFQNTLFASPEGRSYNCTIPMPFQKAGRIEITNESHSYVTLWYDVDYLIQDHLEGNPLYFHTYWSRVPATQVGKDFQILPLVNGTGRYLGANIGVIGNPEYNGTWFGEGEVKIYLDGDKKFPTLVNTGTEDYIGTGGGQRHFYGPYFGSLVADEKNDLYAFYRFHTLDPVFFHNDCHVDLQQIGSARMDGIKRLVAKDSTIKIIWMFEGNGADEITDIPHQVKAPEQVDYLDLNSKIDLNKHFSNSNYANFYRSDDVSATAYFYLDKPQSNLPVLAPVEIRMKDMEAKVFEKIIRKQP